MIYSITVIKEWQQTEILFKCLVAMQYSSYNSVDNYSGIILRNINLSTKLTSNIQAPMPRLIISYQEMPQLFSQVVVNNSCSELWEVRDFCHKCINIGIHCIRVSRISGMEWWNGLLEWNTGMDWDKIFALVCNLKHRVDRYCMTNYAIMMLGTADHVGLTFTSYDP